MEIFYDTFYESGVMSRKGLETRKTEYTTCVRVDRKRKEDNASVYINVSNRRIRGDEAVSLVRGLEVDGVHK
jgi:hypothetical protein